MREPRSTSRLEIKPTVLHSRRYVVQGLQQDRLVNGVGKPRVDEGLRVQGGIHTDAATGLDTVG